MGHSIRWDNDEKTVVLQEYIAPATKDDLYQLAQKSAQMLNSVTHRVHLIIDERNITLTLNSSDMNYLQKLTPDNQGMVAMVTKKESLIYKQVVQKIGQKTAPKAFSDPYFFATIEDAREFLMAEYEVKYGV